jgi:hypothetical protein
MRTSMGVDLFCLPGAALSPPHVANKCRFSSKAVSTQVEDGDKVYSPLTPRMVVDPAANMAALAGAGHKKNCIRAASERVL